MNYLLVVAHPDNEAMGAEATIKRLTSANHDIDIRILCAKVHALRPGD